MAEEPTRQIDTDIGPFAMVPLWLLGELADAPNGTASITVFVALHTWTNRDRTCYPSIDSIAEVAGVTAPTVKRALKTLQDVGALAVTRQKEDTGKRQSKSNLYRLIYSRNHLPTQTREGANDDTPPGSNDDTPRGVNDGTPNHIHRNQIQSSQILVHADKQNRIEAVAESEMLFKRFWEIYPRSQGKQTAMRAWRKMTPDDRRIAVNILPQHVEHWRSSGTEKQFIPHAATWLNGRRWEDVFDTGYEPKGSLVTKAIRFSRAADEWERTQNDRGRSVPSNRQVGRHHHRVE